MRNKKEILKVFDVHPALAGNIMDVVRGMGALCEVLCDIRDIDRMHLALNTHSTQKLDEELKIPPYIEDGICNTGEFI